MIPLERASIPLASVDIPLAKRVLIPLALTAATSTAETGCFKKVLVLSLMVWEQQHY